MGPPQVCWPLWARIPGNAGSSTYFSAQSVVTSVPPPSTKAPSRRSPVGVMSDPGQLMKTICPGRSGTVSTFCGGIAVWGRSRIPSTISTLS